MVDTRRSSAGKRRSPSEEASTPSPPPAASSGSGAADAAGPSASAPAAEAASPPPPKSRSSKRAKDAGKTTPLSLRSPVLEIAAAQKAAAAAKAAGRVTESVPAAERSAGPVAASSTVSNSGAKKKRTTKPLPPSDETTGEEMTVWKMRRGAASSRTQPWGRLISQSSQYPTVPICASYFTVGHGGKHDLKLTDAFPGSLVCRLRHVRRGAALEVSVSKVVHVNGKALDKAAKVTLIGGDEVVFCSLGRHAYIFQPLPEEKSSTSTLSSLSFVQQGQYPLIKGTLDHLSSKRAKLSVPFNFGSGSPLVPHDTEIVSSLCKTMEEQNQFSSEVSVPFAEHQLLKEDLTKTVVSASDISESFDNFPYYLSENTKSSLLTPAHVNLCCKKAMEWTKKISFISQRVLLSGPAGSEIYQETLVKALTKHFDAKLLVVDLSLLSSVSVLTLPCLILLAVD